MPFSLLCCTSSRSYRSKRSEAEAETRRARIVPILDPSEYDHDLYRPPTGSSNAENNDLPPPRYEDTNFSVSLHPVPVLVIDEKDPSTLHISEVHPSEARGSAPEFDNDIPRMHSLLHTTEPNPPPFEGSDRSSIISIPSTQITGLGSSYTGTTTLRGSQTGRSSRDEGRFSETGTLHDVSRDVSRPPSYYASSVQRRSRSVSPHQESDGGVQNEGDGVWRHPVMTEGWFEHLRGTRGQREWRR